VISSLSGELKYADEERAHVAAGPIVYELLVPAVDVPELRDQVGRDVTLHTIFYLQGDGNSFEPVLIGFLRRDDKRFFEKFITVKGIGPKTALRALTVGVSQIAAAIESKDARQLTQLKGIGKRTAELIVAELSGKVGEFVGEAIVSNGVMKSVSTKRFSPAEQNAIDSLVVLGERRNDAEGLLMQAKQQEAGLATNGLATTDALVKAMLKLRS